MRQLKWILLTAALLCLVGVVTADEPNKSREATLTGYGETAAAARASAIREAQDWLTNRLKEEPFNVRWPIPIRLLDPTVLQKHRVLHEGEAPVPDPEGARARGWATAFQSQCHVVLGRDTEAYIKWVQKEVREEQLSKEKLGRQGAVIERQALLWRVLGGVMAALLIVAGYLRMEEATRGYYTRLLRLGAFILFALAVAGLWLTV